MLAFDFSKKSIEVLQFKKPLFGRYTITALGKAELEDEILKNGLPKDEELLSEKILELLGKREYRENEECLFDLPQDSYFFKRLTLASDLSKELVKEEVETALIEETGTAVKNLIYSFSVIRSGNPTQEILVIAALKDTLDSYRRVFLQIGLVPIFAAVESWAVYQGLIEAISDKGLTAVLEAKEGDLGLSFFDAFGPISDFKGKLGIKTLIKDFGNARLEVEEETVQQVIKLILAGESGLGLDPLILEKKLDLSIALAAEYVAVEIKERAVDLSQIKLPTTLFAKTLGLMMAFEESKTEFNLITKGLAPVAVDKHRKQEAGNRRKKTESRRQETEDEYEENRKEVIEETAEDESRSPTLNGYIVKIVKWLIVGGVILLILVGLILVIGAARGSLSNRFTQFIDNTFSGPTPTEVPTPIPTLTPTPLPPTPTPTLVLLKSDLRIYILNGSGVKGAANNASNFFKGLGYGIVKTGNAARYDYPLTAISIKESKKAYLGQLKADLGGKYELSTEIGVVAEAEGFDVQVVVGQK